jgi:uncharacterized protein DUF3297
MDPASAHIAIRMRAPAILPHACSGKAASGFRGGAGRDGSVSPSPFAARKQGLRLSFPHRGTPAARRPAMSHTPPDRLSSDPRSRFHDAAALERGIGVRFNGEEKTNVEEYCVSEGWVRLPFGKTLDRRGNPMTVKVKGVVEPWFKDAG